MIEYWTLVKFINGWPETANFPGGYGAGRSPILSYNTLSKAQGRRTKIMNVWKMYDVPVHDKWDMRLLHTTIDPVGVVKTDWVIL